MQLNDGGEASSLQLTDLEKLKRLGEGSGIRMGLL
jgi:hypothetical protein